MNGSHHYLESVVSGFVEKCLGSPIIGDEVCEVADLAQVVQRTHVNLAAVQQKQARRRRPDHCPLDRDDLLILMVGTAPAYR